jgi:putative ABC transport system ATP-binding protein
MPEPAVRLEGVTVRFDAVTALADLDLEVAPGEFVAVTGHSGAGKTTLLSVVAGVVSPASGSVVVRGAPVTDLVTATAAGVATVPQGNGLAAVLTAHENVLLPLLARGGDPAGAPPRASGALDAVGLADVHSHLVEELSGGQQQRVAVARGLALSAPVLLADEPTSELDHTSRSVVLALLRSQAEVGAAVVMTTHDPEAAAAADRVLHLDDGRFVRP